MGVDGGVEPLLGKSEVGEEWDLIVGNCDCDGYSGVSKALEGLWVGIEESNTVDDGGFEEETGYL